MREGRSVSTPHRRHACVTDPLSLGGPPADLSWNSLAQNTLKADMFPELGLPGALITAPPLPLLCACVHVISSRPARLSVVAGSLVGTDHLAVPESHPKLTRLQAFLGSREELILNRRQPAALRRLWVPEEWGACG